jgi:RHS repeat-associated protein
MRVKVGRSPLWGSSPFLSDGFFVKPDRVLEVQVLVSRSLIMFLATAMLSLGVNRAGAQTCPPATVTVRISVADGSTPAPGETPQTFITAGNPVCQTEGGGWGDVTLVARCGGPNTVTTYTSNYLARTDNVSCTTDGAGCLHCSPNFINAALWARFGSFKGTVSPAGQFGGQIYATDAPISCGYGPDGIYDCAQYYAPPYNSNNWDGSLSVFGDGHGPGYRTVTLVGPGGVQHVATTRSSFGKRVDFLNGVPYEPPEEPEPAEPSDPCTAPPEIPPPPFSCGEPVNVTSGNVFFGQSDASVAVLGGRLDFTRSYNSINRVAGRFGVFGAGWQHTYEQSLSFPGPGRIKLRQGNGRPIYFADPDGDLRYDQSQPFTTDSWILKQRDGSYVRQIRKGGTEGYDAAGRWSTRVDASGNTTTLAYNAGGQLTTITGAGGRVLTLSYVGGKIDTLSGPAGLIATYAYDGSGRLNGVRYADAATSGYTFTYDPASNAVATVADLTGRTIETHAYDSSGRGYTSEISAGRERYTLAFGANQTTVTDALGNTTTYDYQLVWGQNVITRVTGPCETCSGNESQEWTYDDKARILSRKDGNGKVTSYAYDPTTGDLLTVTDPLSHTITYTHDSAGRVLTRADAGGGLITYTQSTAGPTSVTEKVSTTHSRTTSVAYRPDGLVSSVTDPRGKVTSFTYNASGDLASVTDPLLHVTQFEYDAMGRRTKVTDPLLHDKQTAYDIRGNVTRLTDAAGKHTDFAYDAGGRRTSVTDALGRATQYAYDPYGRLATVTDALGGTTQYAYDLMSNLITLTDAKNQTTTFEYDAFRRVKKVIRPGGVFETFTYDAGGRLATRTDRRGIVTTYTYDDASRLTGKSYSDYTPAVSYSYDPVGRLLSADTLTWTYDLTGQMLSEGSAGNSSLVQNVYDDGGNRVTVMLDGTVAMSYSYDDDSRVTSITRGSQVFAFGYDQAHRRTSLAYPSGVGTAYGYDNVDRLTSLVSTRGATPIASFAYSYDDVGNRLSKTTDGSVESYLYDGLDRLTRVSRGATITEQYTYDAVGNRLSSSGATGWSYNARNELLSRPGFTYTYDENGNYVGPRHSSNYVWDAENRLISVRDFMDTPVANFMYDPLGRRQIKGTPSEFWGGGSTTTYIYDGDNILRSKTLTGTDFPVETIADYVHGPGIDEWLALGDTSYYHADALGSIVKSTDAAGGVVWGTQYDAFGNAPGFGAGAFTGREWDEETGLYYYRARYYDPQIGRFISEDPIGFQAGVNFFSYVLNNPTNFTDPFGLDVNVCLFPTAAHNFGHIGFGVSGESSTQGYYDTGGSPFGGPGQIKVDNQEKKVCTVLSATSQQDQCMVSCRERRRRNPGEYHLTKRNCTAFVEDCLIICGLPHGDRNPEPVNLFTRIGPRRR